MNVTYTFYIMDTLRLNMHTTHTVKVHNAHTTHTLTLNLIIYAPSLVSVACNLVICALDLMKFTLMPFSHFAYIITMDCFDLRFYFDLGLRYDGFISEILYKNNILFHRHLSSSS